MTLQDIPQSIADKVESNIAPAFESPRPLVDMANPDTRMHFNPADSKNASPISADGQLVFTDPYSRDSMMPAKVDSWRAGDTATQSLATIDNSLVQDLTAFTKQLESELSLLAKDISLLQTGFSQLATNAEGSGSGNTNSGDGATTKTSTGGDTSPASGNTPPGDGATTTTTTSGDTGPASGNTTPGDGATTKTSTGGDSGPASGNTNPSDGATTKTSTGGDTTKTSTGSDTTKTSTGGDTTKTSTGGDTTKTSTGSDTTKTSTGGDTTKTSTGGDTTKTSTGGDTTKTSTGGDTTKTSTGSDTTKTSTSEAAILTAAATGAGSDSLHMSSEGMSTMNAAGKGFTQEYGIFEATMKLPPGGWPGFWGMSEDHALGSAPASEIDVMEASTAHQPDSYYVTLHSNSADSSTDKINGHNHVTTFEDGTPLPTDLTTAYHTYGVIWPPNSDTITYTLDGKAVSTVPTFDTTDSSPMMLNIGQSSADMLGPSSIKPGSLDVKSVNAYQFASQLNDTNDPDGEKYADASLNAVVNGQQMVNTFHQDFTTPGEATSSIVSANGPADDTPFTDHLWYEKAPANDSPITQGSQ